MSEIRLGHLKHDGTNPTFTFLDDLDPETFQKILDATDVLNKYQFSKNLFQIFDISFKEFIEYPQLILERLVIGQSDQQDQDYYLNCNRLFINFLSSFRAYIDYIATYLKRKYGHTSEHASAFERCTNYFFDEFFAYRFLYKLRNYSQHCGFPISVVNYSARQEKEFDNIKATLELLFDRDELLKNYSEWGKVKKDLQAEEAQFDVTGLTTTLRFCISEFANFS
jgi:hypothetical protein